MSNSLPRNESGDTATSDSHHSRESRNPENQEAATSSKPPLPQGEGWGEGSENPSSSKSIPAKEEINLYDYGRNDPDPAIDYYFEPLNPEEQALFDYEARLESGDFPKGEAPKEPPPPPPSAYAEYSDALKRIKDEAAREGVPVLPNPLAGKLHAVKIRSP